VTAAAVDGRTRVGSYALCVNDSGGVLLCRLSPEVMGAGFWTLPGGGLEFGEHPDAGLMRELEEETGLAGRTDGILMVHARLFPGSAADPTPLHGIGIVYRVSIVGPTEPRAEVDGSTDAVQWFAPETLASLSLTFIAAEALAKAGLVAST